MLALSALAAMVSLQATDFKKAWTEVCEEIRETYIFKESRGAEMESRLKAWSSKATASTSRDEFSDTVNAMLQEFGDSHFYFFTKDDQQFYGVEGAFHSRLTGPEDQRQFPSLGCFFWRDEKGYFVWTIEPNGPLVKAGVERLDRFLTCDGKPFHPIRSLRGRVGQTATFGIERDGKPLTLKLSIKAARFWDEFGDANFGGPFKVGAARFEYRFVADMFPGRNTWYMWYRTQPDVKGVLLDLRDGLGGYFEEFIGPFTMPRSRVDLVDQLGEGHYFTGAKIPTVILVNKRTVSAREVAAYFLRKNIGAVIVGEPTAGGVLGGSVTPTHGGWWNMMIPANTFVLDGHTFERNPLQPDVLVADRVEIDGSDHIFSAGLEKLMDLTGTDSNGLAPKRGMASVRKLHVTETYENARVKQ